MAHLTKLTDLTVSLMYTTNEDYLFAVVQPMSLLERNAAGFHYRITYYRASNTSNANDVTVHTVHDWNERQLVVNSPQLGTYQAYVIHVQAVNNEGEAPTSFLEKRIGYTGQDGMLINNELRCLYRPTMPCWHVQNRPGGLYFAYKIIHHSYHTDCYRPYAFFLFNLNLQIQESCCSRVENQTRM